MRWFDILLLLFLNRGSKPDKITNIWICVLFILVSCLFLGFSIYMFINYHDDLRGWMIGISACMIPLCVLGIVYECHRENSHDN